MAKRRCAGCNRVIDGRPNKLYCSDDCRERAKKRHQRGDKMSPVSASVPSVIRGSNGVVIEQVARLGYFGQPGDAVLDLTYGRGMWWTRFRPEFLMIGQGDFTDRPEVNGSVPVVCFDPPYISTGSRDTSTIDDFYDRFGLGELKGWRAIRRLMDDGLAECARILRPRGYLLVKCMDYVESGSKVWNTFHVVMEAEGLGLRLVDRFVHLSGAAPSRRTTWTDRPGNRSTPGRWRPCCWCSPSEQFQDGRGHRGRSGPLVPGPPGLEDHRPPGGHRQRTPL